MNTSRPTYFPPSEGETYRVLTSSRLAPGREPLEPEELDWMLLNVRLGALFAKISLVGYSLRPTAFDLVLDVPRSLSLSEEEMFARLEAISSPMIFQQIFSRICDDEELAWERLRKRFGSVSEFMKRLKFITSRHYNRLRGLKGRVWVNPFTSMYLEKGHGSRVHLAWLDHAPLREGVAGELGEWRWTTYGGAMADEPGMRQAMQELYLPGQPDADWEEVASAYREFINAEPEIPAAPQKGPPLLTRAEMMRIEVPHFRASVALGDREFVEEVFEINHPYFFPPKRRTGARRVRGQNDGRLFTIRNKKDLRKFQPC